MTTLPELLVNQDGKRIESAEAWRPRRKEILDLLVGIEYGGMPPAPLATNHELLHTSAPNSRFDGAITRSYRILPRVNTVFSFYMTLLTPKRDEPMPVVINGDACWKYLTDDIVRELLGRGYALAQFNRVELAADVKEAPRTSGLYPVYPDSTFGALSAWAWGYHRCVDVLTQLPFIDASKIAVNGHSRGGKTSLLAGATDERIALTCANNSGAGGAGSYRIQGPESERMEDHLRNYPFWFGPKLREFVGRESELPFDQHFLKAAVAPRALLTQEALGDLWANPSGTWETFKATREVYRLLQVEERCGITFREGKHGHTFPDWVTFLDFADRFFFGKWTHRSFDLNPFTGKHASDS